MLETQTYLTAMRQRLESSGEGAGGREIGVAESMLEEKLYLGVGIGSRVQ